MCAERALIEHTGAIGASPRFDPVRPEENVLGHRGTIERLSAPRAPEGGRRVYRACEICRAVPRCWSLRTCRERQRVGEVVHYLIHRFRGLIHGALPPMLLDVFEDTPPGLHVDDRRNTAAGIFRRRHLQRCDLLVDACQRSPSRRSVEQPGIQPG